MRWRDRVRKDLKMFKLMRGGGISWHRTGVVGGEVAGQDSRM